MSKITWAGTMAVLNSFTPESVDAYLAMADTARATLVETVLHAERVLNGSVPSAVLVRNREYVIVCGAMTPSPEMVGGTSYYGNIVGVYIGDGTLLNRSYVQFEDGRTFYTTFTDSNNTRYRPYWKGSDNENRQNSDFGGGG